MNKNKKYWAIVTKPFYDKQITICTKVRILVDYNEAGLIVRDKTTQYAITRDNLFKTKREVKKYLRFLLQHQFKKYSLYAELPDTIYYKAYTTKQAAKTALQALIDAELTTTNKSYIVDLYTNEIIKG